MTETAIMYYSMPMSTVITQINRFLYAHREDPFLDLDARPIGFYLDGGDARVQICLAHLRSGAAALSLPIFFAADEYAMLEGENALRWALIFSEMHAKYVPPGYLDALVLPCTNFFVSARSPDTDTTVNQLHEIFAVDSLTGCADATTGECHIFVVQQKPHLVVDVLAQLHDKSNLQHITVVAVPKGDYSDLSSGTKTPAFLAREFIRVYRQRTGAYDITSGPEPDEDLVCTVDFMPAPPPVSEYDHVV